MITYYNGDCREILRTLQENSINTCVTSPPYFGLRDYGTASWFGGDVNCNHSISMPTKWNDPKRGAAVLRPEVSHRGGNSERCHICGAERVDDQIGLEETPNDYVAKMVEVFREVRRVLRDDGTLWLNLGDSYNGYKGNAFSKSSSSKYAGFRDQPARESGYGLEEKNLKQKDLLGIPWRVAFALQADGWFLRQDIIWHKPNPMPESVTDRCTKAHEYIFLLSKSAKYYFDNEVIKEDSTTCENRLAGVVCDREYGREFTLGETRNKRSVWTVPTSPYSGAHFATYPPDLIEPCILAGCPQGGVVLDPFFGAGTTGLVADRLKRNCIGIELNSGYISIAKKRLQEDAGMFYGVNHANPIT